MCEPWCPPTKAEIEAEERWIKNHPEEYAKYMKKEWWMPWAFGAVALTPIATIVIALIIFGHK
jgi:hypothetical protein